MNLTRLDTPIPGCYELRPRQLTDVRGMLVKTFNRDWFAALGLCTDWAEQYYSVSAPFVLRGLHFQRPPYDHAKLIYCISGCVQDVALDLRTGSPTYGQHFSLELSAETANMIYLPPGLAHGICCLDQPATLIFNNSTVYQPEADAGIRWDSAHIDWSCKAPQLSDRDRAFPALAGFISPFSYAP